MRQLGREGGNQSAPQVLSNVQRQEKKKERKTMVTQQQSIRGSGLSDKSHAIHSLKSWLFTPATKADRFGRAAEVGAAALTPPA